MLTYASITSALVSIVFQLGVDGLLFHMYIWRCELCLRKMLQEWNVYETGIDHVQLEGVCGGSGGGGRGMCTIQEAGGAVILLSS